MSGAPRALQCGRHARRRLQHHHFVEFADVDAHFQRTGRDDGLQFTGLQALFHGHPDITRQRAVVGIRNRFNLIQVDLQCDAFGKPAAVREDQRGAIARRNSAQRRGNWHPDLLARGRGSNGLFR